MIYRGYAIFRKHRGVICPDSQKFHQKQWRGNLTCIGPREIIFTKEENDLEEQVKTIIHELLHLGIEGYEGVKRSVELEEITQEELYALEKEVIDPLTEIIYQNQPILVNHIRKKIQEIYIKFHLEYQI